MLSQKEKEAELFLKQNQKENQQNEVLWSENEKLQQ